MGEDPDSLAQEQAEGWGGEGGAEKVSIEFKSSVLNIILNVSSEKNQKSVMLCYTCINCLL